MATNLFVIKQEPEAISISRARRVKSSRMLAGLSRKELSERYGISAATLRSWEDPKGSRKGLTEKGAHRLIKALSDEGVTCSLSWLMNGNGSAPTLTKPGFNLSEPSDVHWSEEETIFRELEYFKEINVAPIVALVSDRGMEPYYEQNAFVAGNKLYNNDISSLIGLNCIVETADGNVYIRRLQKGSKKEKYTLQCLNPVQEIEDLLITDVELVSAAEIIWYRKRSQYRGN